MENIVKKVVAVAYYTKCENRSLTREFLQQYLIEKQNGSLEMWSLTGGGRLMEVVATRELTVR